MTSAIMNEIRDQLNELRGTPFNHCDAFHNTTQAISTAAAPVVLSLNSESVDTNSMHDNSTNNSRVTIPTSGDGTYKAIGSSLFTIGGIGNVSLRKNGSTIVKSLQYCSSANGDIHVLIEHVVRGLVAGDYLELIAEPTTGGASGTAGHATAALSTRLVVIGPWPAA